MKNALAVILNVALLASTALAAKGPDIKIIDNQVSVQVQSYPLGRLIRLLDQATGMTSKVPPELANRNISVSFSNLKFDDAIRKIFEGQSLDYIVVPGKSIMVTGLSKAQTATNGAAPYNPPQDNNNNNPFENDNRDSFMPPQPINPANQPAVIQTPFGPMQNPNRQAQGQAGQQPNGPMPMVLPGQSNTGINGNAGFSNNPFSSSPNPNGQGQGINPGMQTNPFGTTPNTPQTTPSGLPTSPFPSTAAPRPNP